MKGKKKTKRRTETTSPMSYHENPSVRIEKASNGLVIHDHMGTTKVAKTHDEAFKHAKGMLKIG